MMQKAQIAPAAWAGRVALIAKPGDTHTGVGRYVEMLQQGLSVAGIAAERVAPALPPLTSVGYRLLSKLGLDARAFFNNYPVWAKYPRADVYHLTSQNLASLLLSRRPPGKIVVTVHDIIPYMLRDNPQLNSYRGAADRLFDRLAMAGLKRADALIADSQYTKASVVQQLGIPAERIDVIYLGIDHQRFRPLVLPAGLRARYGLPEDRRYLIYVGSDDPRKNLPTLVRALAVVRRTLPEVELIKVGRAHFDAERQKLIALSQQLGVAHAIHWLDDVPEDELPLLYNLANLCVMPSLYEGFGFPVLEAMACGTPVVCANASSLPELAGKAGLMFVPELNSIAPLTEAIGSMLSNDRLAHDFGTRGMEQAAQFTWAKTSQETVQHYSSY